MHAVEPFCGLPFSPSYARNLSAAIRNTIRTFLKERGYSESEFDPRALDIRVIHNGSDRVQVIDGFAIVPPGWKVY